MKKLALAFLLTVTASAAVSCKKGEPASTASSPAAARAPVGSCDSRPEPMMSMKSCLEYTGSGFSAKEAQARCPAPKKFLAGPCPSEGVVFSCKTSPGGLVEGIQRFYNQPDKAKQLCASLGGVAM